MTLATPIVLAEGLDVTFYGSVDDVWFDIAEAWYAEEVDYRLYDATGRRLELVAEGPDYEVRAVEDAPTGAEELAGLLRLWLPLAGVELRDAHERTLPELLDLAVRHAGLWQPGRDLGVARGLAVAFLAVVALVFAVFLAAAVAATDDVALQVVQALAGGAAVAALVPAAVRIWRRRRWWPWIAAHVVLMTVATAAVLAAG